MGTRSGDVDPGLVLYLIHTAGMTAGEVDSLLNHQSGLRGLSGLSADVRDLEQAAREGDDVRNWLLMSSLTAPASISARLPLRLED